MFSNTDYKRAVFPYLNDSSSRLSKTLHLWTRYNAAFSFKISAEQGARRKAAVQIDQAAEKVWIVCHLVRHHFLLLHEMFIHLLHEYGNAPTALQRQWGQNFKDGKVMLVGRPLHGSAEY